MGVDKKAMGNADATSCHVMEATIVVIKAPSNPVSKKAWTPSETPKIFAGSRKAQPVSLQLNLYSNLIELKQQELQVS